MKHIPALQDCPHIIALMQSTIDNLTKEVALLQTRVMRMEPKEVNCKPQKRMLEQYADEVNKEIEIEKYGKVLRQSC